MIAARKPDSRDSIASRVAGATERYIDFPALLRLTRKDLYALILFSMLGLLTACVISDAIWAAYAAALVTDHFFLGWMLLLRDERVERPLPVMAIFGLHLAFVVVVLVLVANRDHIPRFGVLPLPLAAIGLWILSSAAGRVVEGAAPEGVQPHRHMGIESHERLRHGRTGGVAGRGAARLRLVEAPAAAADAAPAGSGPAALAAIANRPAHRLHPAQTEGEAQPVERLRIYEPVVDGLDLAGTSASKPDKADPEFYHDDSVAAGIRQKHDAHLTRLMPILAATAEDHEEWLKERGTKNPTHRKPGMSVREEYEAWLISRAQARIGQETMPNHHHVN